jgi:hypothetical protein
VYAGSHVVVVANPSDLLADLIARHVLERGHYVTQLGPSELSSCQVCLQEDDFLIGGRKVDGVVFRVSPDMTFSDDYQLEDRSFCDAETRAVWLAVLNLQTVLAVNRYDAHAWFEGIGWPTWRHHLIKRRIEVGKMSFGDIRDANPGLWYPYSRDSSREVPGRTAARVLGVAIAAAAPSFRCLVVDSKILDGENLPNVHRAATVLKELGIVIAEVSVDSQQKILAVNTLPQVSEPHLRRRVAAQIAGLFDAHLSRR